MKKGIIAYLKEEGYFFDPNYSLYEDRKIQKGQKLEIVTTPDAEGQLTVKFVDGELMGEELRLNISDLFIK